MEVGIVGKPSSGKTTFFDAATMANAEIGNYPFTTIKPNVGTAFVRIECPHKTLGTKCNPRSGFCLNGIRFVPFQILDVAGLVPGAHEGRGLGNQFLNDLMQAKVLIHVVDMSGRTDGEGKPTKDYDPANDIEFLQDEIDFWIESILEKNWSTITRKARMGVDKLEELVYQQLSGLGMQREQVYEIVRRTGIDEKKDSLLDLAKEIRRSNKPIVIAANKIDLPESKENLKRIRDKSVKFSMPIIPVSAEAELALKKASESGVIRYIPGSPDFEIIKDLTQNQKKALDYIRENVLEPYGNTGVQQVLETAVYDVLGMKVVFPVEDENKWADKNGRVLPDAFLLKKDADVMDLAEKVHSEIAERAMGAIDCRTKRKIGKDHVLQNGDVVKILVR